MNEHSTDEQITRFLDATLPPRELAATANHLADCPACAAAASTMYDVNAAADTVRREINGGSGAAGFSRPAMWWTALAAMLTAVAILSLLWMRPTGMPSAPPQLATSAPVEQHPEWRALTDAVLAAGRIEPPAVLRELRPPAPSLRVPRRGPPPAKLAPAGVVVESDRPRFTWDAVRGAQTYVVLVFSDGREAARSGKLARTGWQPEAPLARGAMYEWQVVAATAHGEVVLPPADAPRALFRVLSAEAAAEIDRARRERPDDALLLGVLYAREGVVDRAEEQLRAFPALHRSVLEWR